MFRRAATCYHFNGLLVRWRGEVESVTILHRGNILEDILYYLPQVTHMIIHRGNTLEDILHYL